LTVSEEMSDTGNLASAITTPSPPKITSIDFPSEIPGDNTPVLGSIYFEDPDGDINSLTFEVIRATKFSGATDNDPYQVLESGDKMKGAFKFNIKCQAQQSVTLRVTLSDEAGNNSNSMDFSFNCN
jgi:hypothetical protein